MAVESVGSGPGRHQPGRSFHGSFDQRRLPRLCMSRGLENRGGQCSTCLETRMDRAVALVSNTGSRRMDCDRHERSRPVCPLVVSGDRRFGLASADANYSHEQVPHGRISVEQGGHIACFQGGSAMARSRCCVSEEGVPTARLHTLVLLGGWSRRTLVCGHRLGAGPERALVVRHARLDRTRVQTVQTRRLAMADDPDDRPRSRESVVAGAGCGHPLHPGCRRGSRRGRNAGRDVARDRCPLAHHASRRAGRCSPGSGKTNSNCYEVDTFVASPQNASVGNQTAIGERLPAGIGGIERTFGYRPRVVETSMETRAMAGDPSRLHQIRRSTSDACAEKPLPLSPSRWEREPVFPGVPLFKLGAPPRLGQPSPQPSPAGRGSQFSLARRASCWPRQRVCDNPHASRFRTGTRSQLLRHTALHSVLSQPQ